MTASLNQVLITGLEDSFPSASLGVARYGPTYMPVVGLCMLGTGH